MCSVGYRHHKCAHTDRQPTPSSLAQEETMKSQKIPVNVILIHETKAASRGADCKSERDEYRLRVSAAAVWDDLVRPTNPGDQGFSCKS